MSQFILCRLVSFFSIEHPFPGQNRNFVPPVVHRLYQLAFALSVALVLALAPPTAGQARSATIALVGDSIANDLGRGMQAYFAGNLAVNVVKRTRHSTGLVRTDYYDWNKAAAKFVASSRAGYVVVVMGGNDRQSFRMGGRRIERFTGAWFAEYERRVARFMSVFKRAKGKVYWMGLPPVRSGKMSRDYRRMNAIYRRQAAKHGIRFISIWKVFTDKRGRYTSFGRDVSGVERPLRTKDGLHFNADGRKALAAFIARQIGVVRK
jgi:hypothetical protein